jgi:genome maintenance exonuclease 1
MSLRKTFQHKFYTFPDLSANTTESGRYYTLPDGTSFPSVTTVLGRKLDKTGLEQWKKCVGEEEAAKISTQAARRGTSIHDMCEKYLLNEDYKKGVMPANLATFSSIRSELDDNVGMIYGIESPLHSHKLMTAGRTDLIADWCGAPSIIDFKTSRKLKEEQWIQGYFLQATCYSMMVEELTDLQIANIVIIIAVDHEYPQVFTRNSHAFRNQVTELFTK